MILLDILTQGASVEEWASASKWLWFGLSIFVVLYYSIKFFTLRRKYKRHVKNIFQQQARRQQAYQQQQSRHHDLLSDLFKAATRPERKIDEKLLEKIFKLYKLAKQGVDGEKDNAKTMYLKMLEKHNISQKEFLDEYKIHGEDKPK